MRDIDCLLFWIVNAGAVAAALSFIDNQTCGIASLVTWGMWAFLKNWLEQVMILVNCQPKSCL